jgi:outer membrane protein OmpA-like peptidoglycan-associated protein
MSSRYSVEHGIWMVAGVCAVFSLTSCLAPTRSDLANRINVCGQQYVAKATVVAVEKQPQWLITEPHTCVDHPVLSPQPQPRVETTKTQELVPIKTAMMGVLQGLPRFVLPGQSIPAAGIAVATPVLPGSVQQPLASTGGGQGPSMRTCENGSEVVRQVIQFALGSNAMTESERAKLARFHGIPVSYFHLEGFTDPTGSVAMNEALAMERAQGVSRALFEVVGKHMRVEVTGRAGCCHKSTNAETRRVEVTGVMLKPCQPSIASVPSVTPANVVSSIKSIGGTPSMAK